jgi:hypothetical protein
MPEKGKHVITMQHVTFVSPNVSRLPGYKSEEKPSSSVSFEVFELQDNDIEGFPEPLTTYRKKGLYSNGSPISSYWGSRIAAEESKLQVQQLTAKLCKPAIFLLCVNVPEEDKRDLRKQVCTALQDPNYSILTRYTIQVDVLAPTKRLVTVIWDNYEQHPEDATNETRRCSNCNGINKRDTFMNICDECSAVGLGQYFGHAR